MRKFALIAALPAVLCGAPAAWAVDSSGCGLGTQVWEGESGVFPQVLAVTTNGTSGNQTFGISTGTSGCVQNGTVRAPQRVAMFMGNNIDRLALDMSRGQGESLTTLADLKGVAPTDRAHFYQVAQANVGDIFKSDRLTAGEALANLDAILVRDPLLRRYATA